MKDMQKASIGGVEFYFRMGQTDSKEYLKQLGLSNEEIILKSLYRSKDGKSMLRLREGVNNGYLRARIARKEEVNGEIIFQTWKEMEITKEYLEDQFEKVKNA